MVHLYLAALLMVCYHYVCEFGSLIALGTLEVGTVLAVLAVFCHYVNNNNIIYSIIYK